MPKGKKYGYNLDFDDFLEMAYKIDELGGTEALKKATENALRKSGEYAMIQMGKAMKASGYNFTAGQGYSQGGAKKALQAALKEGLTWTGSVAEMPVGFDLEVDADILFAIYGTPHMKPDKNLYNAVKLKGNYGKQVSKIQEAEFLGSAALQSLFNLKGAK